LDSCLANHAECNAGLDSSPLPTRVIDVGISFGDGDPVKVLETNGLSGKYLTLSHCWGDPDLMPTKLTARTLEEYKKGVPYDSLPRTFQDAVTFTRKMGIHYLWIDSLCIIQPECGQDSKLSDQDWEQEIGRMNDVYRNSHLTLAAATSTSCTGGLLFETKTTDISVPGAAAKDAEPYQIFARKKSKHLQSNWALMKRGWVAQEYFLSPRTLLFTDTELVWRCRKHHTCQCRAGPASQSPWEYTKLLEPTVLHPTRDELARLWYIFINSYSVASLSFQTDKLAAVDGIVQYMRPLRNSENIAGLWADTFALDLLWMPSTKAKRRRPVWSTPEHLFPTWSWASVPYSVCWPGSVNYPYPLPKVPLPQGTLVTLVDQDRRAGTPANRVTIRGTLVTATLGEVRKNPEGKKVWYHSDCEDDDVLGDDTVVHCLRAS
ncbi:HET-domain-containing protein, partial [Parathielavia appendiculata]